MEFASSGLRYPQVIIYKTLESTLMGRDASTTTTLISPGQILSAATIQGAVNQLNYVNASGPDYIFVDMQEFRENMYLQRCRNIRRCHNRYGVEIYYQEYRYAMECSNRARIQSPRYGRYYNDQFEEQQIEQAKHNEEKARKEKERADEEYQKKEKAKKHNNNIKKLYWTRVIKEENNAKIHNNKSRVRERSKH